MFSPEATHQTPQSAQLFQQVMKNYGQQMSWIYRFSDFRNPDNPNENTPTNWRNTLGDDVIDRYHLGSTALIANNFVAKQPGLDPLQKQLLLTIPWFHDLDEIKINSAGSGDIPDPLKTSEGINLGASIYQVVVLQSALELLNVNITSNLKPLTELKKLPPRIQFSTLNKTALELKTLLLQQNSLLVGETASILYAYDDIVKKKTPPLGPMFRAIEKVGYLQTSLTAFNAPITNAKAFGAEVVQFHLSHLISYAHEYPYINRYLLENSNLINQVISEVNVIPDDKMQVVKKGQITSLRFFNRQKFNNSATKFKAWLNQKNSLISQSLPDNPADLG